MRCPECGSNDIDGYFDIWARQWVYECDECDYVWFEDAEAA